MEGEEAPRVHPWEVVLLGLALAALVVVNAAWLEADQAPPFEHSGRSIRDAVQIWQSLRAGGGVPPDVYPPLAYLASAAAFAVFGVSMKVALLSQFAFLAPYLAGCWWIGRELGGRGGGLLTLLAAAGSPWMSLHLHGYFLEVGTTAMVAVAFACLLASRGCRRPGPTLGLGLALGLGMLSKWSFLFFVGPAMLWPLAEAWRDGRASRALAGATAACLVVTAGLLQWASSTLSPAEPGAFPWRLYILALDLWLVLAVFAFRARRLEPTRRRRPPGPWNAGAGLALACSLGVALSSWWYLESLWELRFKVAQDMGQGFSTGHAAGILLGALATSFWAAPLWLAVGAAAGFALKPLRIPTAVALAGIALPLAVYVVTRVPPGPRYLLPATVLVFAISFAWWGRTRGAAALAVPVALLGVLQVAAWYLPAPAVTEALRTEATNPWRVPTVPPPDPQVLPVDRTVDRVLAELDASGEFRLSAVIMPGARFDPDNLLLEAILRDRVLDIEHFLPGRSAGDPRTSLIVLTGDQPEDLSWLAGYEILECWEAPGWGRWCLYRHPTRRDDRPPPRAGHAPGP